MAPPSPRRPGFSRRAQYSLFAAYVAAVAGALMGLLLLVTAYFDPRGNAAIQSFFGDIFAPFSAGGAAAIRFFEDGGDAVSAYLDAASKNEAMTSELAAARQKVIKGQADALENQRLKKLLAVVERTPERVVVAQLISSTGASSRRYAMLSAGSRSGVKVGQPVRAPEGLVGRVVQAGLISARILLIIDAGNIVPVRRARDGVPALAYGLGDGRIDLRPLAAGTNPFAVGDIFITSGTGGIYQPGIPVAIAIARGRDGTTARPLADPTQLDYAIVESEFVPPLPPPPGALPSQSAP